MINFLATYEILWLVIAIFSALFYLLSVHHIMLEGLPERLAQDRSNFDYLVIAVFYLTRVTLVISVMLLLTDLFVRG